MWYLASHSPLNNIGDKIERMQLRLSFGRDNCEEVLNMKRFSVIYPNAMECVYQNKWEVHCKLPNSMNSNSFSNFRNQLMTSSKTSAKLIHRFSQQSKWVLQSVCAPKNNKLITISYIAMEFPYYEILLVSWVVGIARNLKMCLKNGSLHPFILVFIKHIVL